MRVRGFSMLEAILTVFLMTVILAAVASLMTSIGKVSRRANELSWKTAALSMISKLELDAHRAADSDLGVGGSSNTVQFTIRDTEATEFLPDAPLTTWSIDDPLIQLRVTFSVANEKLVRTSLDGLGASSSSNLGEVDNLLVERNANGNFRVELTRKNESISKEFRSFSLQSLAAPL